MDTVTEVGIWPRPAGVSPSDFLVLANKINQYAYGWGTESFAEISSDATTITVSLQIDGLGEATVSDFAKQLSGVVQDNLDRLDPSAEDPSMFGSWSLVDRATSRLTSENRLLITEQFEQDPEIRSFIRLQAVELGLRVDFKHRADLAPAHGIVFTGVTEILLAQGVLFAGGVTAAAGADAYKTLKTLIIKWLEEREKKNIKVSDAE